MTDLTKQAEQFKYIEHLKELDRFNNDPIFAAVVNDLENAYKEIERISYSPSPKKQKS